MKRKVGTTLDAALYERAKQVARRQRRTANALIEDALSRFLAASASPASVVSETRGIVKVSSRAVRAVLREDLLPEEFVTASQEFRQTHGLLVNDSLIPMHMRQAGISLLASADKSFDGIPGIRRFAPSDI